ncbi:MAG: nucleoside hydrolase, partial [Shinella sp.]
AGGIADGQTIQKPDTRSFPPGNWDDLPSQHACIGIDAEKVMALLDETLVR